MSRKRRLPPEALVDLRRRLDAFPPRSAERRKIIRDTANLYDLSESGLYRALSELAKPKSVRRADHGLPRVLPKATLERYCKVIAAISPRRNVSACWNNTASSCPTVRFRPQRSCSNRPPSIVISNNGVISARP